MTGSDGTGTEPSPSGPDEPTDPRGYEPAAGTEDEEYQEPDRSGLSAADFEPRKQSALGRRLRFLTGWQVVVAVVVILVVVPLILAVALGPLISLLSRS